MSGRMLIPRDPRAKGGLVRLPSVPASAGTYAEAHDIPARTRVS